jgi:hypothetical protein
MAQASPTERHRTCLQAPPWSVWSDRRSSRFFWIFTPHRQLVVYETRRWAMVDGACVELQAEVLGSTALLMRCRVGERIVGVHPLRLLPGTEVRRAGDFGKIVLPSEVARSLGLLPSIGQ